MEIMKTLAYRWEWFGEWVMDYWNDDQPFSGILCPLLGRHWYHTWRGETYMFDHWDNTKHNLCWRCFHCGGSEILKTEEKEPTEAMV